MLTYRDSDQSFKLVGDLLETMTNYDFNIDHSNPQDGKIIYEFGREMKFIIRQKRRKSIRDKVLLKLPKSPAIMASGISRKSLPENPNELCDRLKLFLQEKRAGNNTENLTIESLL